jgi:hypothetical protein
VPKTIQEERVRIKCKVSLGLFTNERGVRIELPDGRAVSALVDKSQVEEERMPKSGEEVDGFVWASVVKESDDRYVIDLPQPTLTGGTRVLVPKSIVVSSLDSQQQRDQGSP